MKTMAVSEFKAHALKALKRVAETREGIIITKRGKPLAQILPFSGKEAEHKPGKLTHTLVYEKDIVTPLGSDEWEADQ